MQWLSNLVVACLDMSENYLKELPESSKEWDELQLPHGHKDMLASLVESHFHNKRPAVPSAQKTVHFDSIAGKGLCSGWFP